MTNEELFDDLKQFIEATITQRLSHFATKEDLAQLATKEDINSIRGELRLLDDKLDTIHDAVADTVQDHERRIGRLEQRIA